MRILSPFASPGLRETLRRRAATLLGAVLIGLVALAFASISDQAQRLFSTGASVLGPWLIVITPAGFMLLVYLTRRLMPEARGSGIPQVIAAARLSQPERSPLISLKAAIAK